MDVSETYLAEQNDANVESLRAENQGDEPLPLDGLAELEEAGSLGIRDPDQGLSGSQQESSRVTAEGSSVLWKALTVVTSHRPPRRSAVAVLLLSCLAMFGVGWKQGAAAREGGPMIKVRDRLEESAKSGLVIDATFRSLDVSSTGRSTYYSAWTTERRRTR